MQVVIPMGGLGTRFHSYNKPKPLIDVLGKPMVVRAIQSLDIEGSYFFVVRRDEHLQEVCSLLRDMKPDCMIHVLEHVTRGAAESVLKFEQQLNPEEELIVANCDQIMDWNSSFFIDAINTSTYDGIVVTYFSTTEKNSYARLDENGFVSEIREKEVISNESLNGIHYWRKAKYFIESAHEMMNARDTVNNEYYIAPTYNYMIQSGRTVGVYHIPVDQHHPVGTPDDLNEYLKKYENRKN